MKIFLMCQGKGILWREESKISEKLPSEVKHLMLINGEHLVCRTLRQLKGNDVTLVGLGDIFRKYCNHIFTLREPTGSLIDGIIRTSPRWDENGILFLLGDVVYSYYAISVILSGVYSKSPFTLFGRLTGNLYTGKARKEIFALYIPSMTDEMCNLFEQIRQKSSAGLWDLYNVSKTIVPIADYTDDIDSPEEYIKFYSKLQDRVNWDDNFGRIGYGTNNFRKQAAIDQLG